MIRLESISKKYQHEYALKDITCTIKADEVLTVIGPSGSGKSSLLRIINGLDTATKGSVYIENTKVTIKNQQKLCLNIGMVFQHCHLFPHMNILQNLIYAPYKVLNMDIENAKNKAMELLEYFGLTNKVSTMPNDLSGGQKQRVAIIRAMMMEPKMLCLDEPTSALDPEVIKDVREIIVDLKAKTTIMVVTHHLKFAHSIADRVIFMDKGQILCDQLSRDFFVKPDSVRAQLFLDNVQDFM